VVSGTEEGARIHRARQVRKPAKLTGKPPRRPKRGLMLPTKIRRIN
jgi:hypothetical protein